MEQLIPISTIDLFPQLDKQLIDLLKSLSLDDWDKQTIAPLWKVKDVAVHLLDGNIRVLSMLRDGYFGETPSNISTYQDLLVYLNGLNADWVKGMKRVSPTVLIQLLESTGREFIEYYKTLDPFDVATFSVAWAGEEQSANWFHIARDYTEKWHHQQQIRLAVGQEAPLYSRELYFPYLETSMRALPHHYRDVKANEGDTITFKILGEGGGIWHLIFNAGKWKLASKEVNQIVCEVEIEDKIAWRIFTKGITKQEAESRSSITGKIELGTKIFEMLAVMA